MMFACCTAPHLQLVLARAHDIPNLYKKPKPITHPSETHDVIRPALLRLEKKKIKEKKLEYMSKKKRLFSLP